MKINETIAWGANQLKQSFSPRLDAELLLAYSCKLERSDLYKNINQVVTQSQLKKYKTMIGKRIQSIPVAHIINKKDFYNLTFHVNTHTLVPRPETEAIVDRAIKIAKSKEIKKIYDIGTGSGNIAIAIAKNLPDTKLIASDICKRALNVAKRNVLNYNLEKQVKLVHSNLSDHIKTAPLVVANLPYVPEHYEVSKDILHEPKKALFAGADGLDLYRKLFSEKLFKKFNGIILIEFGTTQYEPMVVWLTQHFRDVKITPIRNIDDTISGLEADFS